MSENKSDAGNHGKTGRDAASEEGAPSEGIDFITFIMSLATSALIQMGEHEDGSAGGPVNLPLAKQTIDIIGLLREKTRGNLDAHETQILDSALYNLRLRFLEMNKSHGQAG